MGLRKNVQFFPVWYCPECGRQAPNGLGVRSETTLVNVYEEGHDMISCHCGATHRSLDGELIPRRANTMIDQIADYATDHDFLVHQQRSMTGWRQLTMIHESTFVEVNVGYIPRKYRLPVNIKSDPDRLQGDPDRWGYSDRWLGEIDLKVREIITQRTIDLPNIGDVFKVLADPMGAADNIDPHK